MVTSLRDPALARPRVDGDSARKLRESAQDEGVEKAPQRKLVPGGEFANQGAGR